MMADFLTAAEAARRLGVTRHLYAYVSRGVLTRSRPRTAGPACSAPTRSSGWPAGAARAARPGSTDRGGVGHHRAHRRSLASAVWTLCGWLSAGPSRRSPSCSDGRLSAAGEPWQARPGGAGRGPGRAGRAARRGAAARAAPGDRPGDGGYRPAPAPARPAGRGRRRRERHRRHGGLPARLVWLAGAPGDAAAVRWPGGCGLASATIGPAPGLRAASAALVLLADHELAASTLAARAAASVRADPYAVVGTGLGAVSGALHGGASLGAEALLAAARRPGRCAPGGGRTAAPGREGARLRSLRLSRRRPAATSCSTWSAWPRRNRASSRWPRPSSRRSGTSPCQPDISSPRPPWPGWRAWSGARGRRCCGLPDGGLGRPRPGGLHRPAPFRRARSTPAGPRSAGP